VIARVRRARGILVPPLPAHGWLGLGPLWTGGCGQVQPVEERPLAPAEPRGSLRRSTV